MYNKKLGDFLLRLAARFYFLSRRVGGYMPPEYTQYRKKELAYNKQQKQDLESLAVLRAGAIFAYKRLCVVPISEIKNGHLVSTSEHMKDRAQKLASIGPHISIWDITNITPSDLPIVLHKKKDHYVVLSGNGRVAACRAAGVKTIEAFVCLP